MMGDVLEKLLENLEVAKHYLMLGVGALVVIAVAYWCWKKRKKRS
jgi:membrane protein DedA with SNARE-associated domain